MSERIKSAIPAEVMELCDRLREHGYRGWIVGGCVRDILRGGEAKDWDIATSARPEAVMKTFRRVIPTGVEHGTVTVMWRGAPYEVTTLRGEGQYSDGRRPDEVFFVDDIESDLARRDFTVNALAYDPVAEVLVDPFGGQRDIELRTLRAVGVAAERFHEDGLRILRAARFCATLGFDIEEATEAAIPGSLDIFRRVSPERVREEWLKALGAPQPAPAFEAMVRTGIMGVTFPELAAVAQGEESSAMKAGWQMVNGPGRDWEWRLAGLVHAVGSGSSAAPLVATEASSAADIVNGWARRYRFSNQERLRLTHRVRHQGAALEVGEGEVDIRRFAREVGRDDAGPLVDFCANLLEAYDAPEAGARLRALHERVVRGLASEPPLEARDLALKGGEMIKLLGRRGGPWVKRLQAELVDAVLEEPSRNQRDELVRLVQSWGDKNPPGETV